MFVFKMLFDNDFLCSFQANHSSVLQSSILQPVAHLPVAATELLSYLQLHFLTHSLAVVHDVLMGTRGAHLFHADVISVQANFLMLHCRKSYLFYHNFYFVFKSVFLFDDAKLGTKKTRRKPKICAVHDCA